MCRLYPEPALPETCDVRKIEREGEREIERERKWKRVCRLYPEPALPETCDVRKIERERERDRQTDRQRESGSECVDYILNQL